MGTFVFLLIITIACVFQAMVGFGYALITTPFALLFLSPATLVTAFTVISLVFNYLLFRKINARIEWRLVSFLLLACFLGMPLGIWILKNVPVNFLRIAINFLVVFFSVLLLRGSFKIPQKTGIIFFAGLVGGLLSTSIGVNGPPVIFLFSGFNFNKDVFRRNLALFFLVAAMASATLLMKSGAIDHRGILLGFLALPVVYFSGRFGNLLSDKISRRFFKALVFLGVLASGVYGLIRAITS